MLRGSNSGFWDWDIQTGAVYYDDVFHTMLGYRPGDLPADLEGQGLVH